MVEEVNIEEEKDAKEDGKGDSKENGKGDDEDWGTVHDHPVTDDLEEVGVKDDTDLDTTEPFKEAEDVEKSAQAEQIEEEKGIREAVQEEKIVRKEELEEKEQRKQKLQEEQEDRREEEQKKKEDEQKKRIEEKKRKEEALKKKEEEQKKNEEEQKKKEEEQKREEEKQKRMKEEQKKKEDNQKIVQNETSNGMKRKSNSDACPASKVKKAKHSKPDKYWKILRSKFMIGESALTLEELIETDVIDRGVLVFLLDISKTDDFFQDYFNKFEGFESAERLLVEDRFTGVYLVTFEESETADNFVKLQRTLWDGSPLTKVIWE